MQQTFNNQYVNNMHSEFINLFHELGLPMHFNHTGTKTFTNYHRIAVIVLYYRSKKSLRDFVEELNESKWISWLGLKKAPKKSTLHDWLKLFGMKALRLMNSLVLPKNSKLTAIDGSGVDSWQRSRHYARRIGEPPMPYAKIDLFVDVEKQMILDFSLIMKKEHDSKSATKIFKRNNLRDKIILGDKGYDSEPLHELVRSKGGKLFAPVRKMDKKGLKRKKPKGRYRRLCIELPSFMGQRSIVENIIYVLKQTQIISLRSKKDYMKKREFAWHIILFNIKKKIRVNNKDKQTLIFLSVWIYVIPDNAWLEKVLKTQLRYKIYRLDYVSISYLNSRDIGHNVEDKNES